MERSRPASSHRLASASSLPGSSSKPAMMLRWSAWRAAIGEGLLLAAAADQYRDAIPIARFGKRRLGGVPLAGKRRSLAFEHRVKDLQRFLQPLESLGEGTELETELTVFEFEPARPGAQASSHQLVGGAEHRQWSNALADKSAYQAGGSTNPIFGICHRTDLTDLPGSVVRSPPEARRGLLLDRGVNFVLHQGKPRYMRRQLRRRKLVQSIGAQIQVGWRDDRPSGGREA